MATTINAGRVRFVSRGTYNNSTQYYLFDLVDYNGSSYIAKENTLGNLPTNTQYWQLIAEKGNTGNDGQTGPVGATGNGISSITKTGTSGLVDTYTITYTNGNTTTFTITNGEDGEVTETELNVLRQKLENQQKVIDQLPQVTGQGTEVTLENTIEAPFTKFDVEGNSEQDGTPSPDNEVPILSSGDNENLFDTSLLPITKNGVTISKDSKGNVVLNGSPTITSGYINFIVSSKKQLSAGTYTVSFEQKKVGIGSVIVGWGNAYLNLTLDETINKKTATINDNGEAQFNINLRYDVGTLDNFILNPKLEKGNKATPYSPYGMGSINEKVQNKNLFDIEKAVERFENWVGDSRSDWGRYENGVVNIVKSNGAHGYYGFAGQKFAFNKGASCTLSAEVLLEGTNSASGVRIGVEEREKDNTSIGSAKNIDIAKNKWTHITIIVSFTEAVTNARVQIEAANTGNTVQIKNIQLEPGSTATPYISHEEQTYSIPVQQPMRSIGDVRDCFVKKSDGKLYERHYISRKMIEGTESWTSQQNCFTFNIDDIKPTPNYADRNQLIAISNFFIGQPSSYRGEVLDLRICKTIDAGNSKQIAIKDTSKTLAEFKAELAEKYANGKPVYVDYLLEESLDLPCTEEQIQQLENLPSTYKEMTIINSEDETPAYLEVSGIYDLNKLINN